LPLSGEAQQWFAVARVLRARGNKGEVAVELLTDFPERLSKVREVFLAAADKSGEPQRFAVSSFWLNQHKKSQAQAQGVFHLAGVNSISAAEELRGRQVLLPIEQRVTLPAGMYFVSDLIGCSVFQHSEEAATLASSPCSLAEAPQFLGKVADVEFIGDVQQGTPLLHVDTAQGDLLIPLAVDICFRVSTAERRIDVKLPEGLRELNAPD
jgi:16S rRNA processing protein RimM